MSNLRFPGQKSDFLTALETCFSSEDASDLITVSNLKYLKTDKVKVIRINAFKGWIFKISINVSRVMEFITCGYKISFYQKKLMGFKEIAVFCEFI